MLCCRCSDAKASDDAVDEASLVKALMAHTTPEPPEVVAPQEPEVVAPPAASATPAASYTVEVRKQSVDDRLGLHMANGTLTVVRIEQGLVLEWNAANPDSQVAVGDRILSVNDVSADVPVILRTLVRAEGKVVLRCLRAT
mmetsp:Transcript_33224/g.94489  ORF Transcript_33224/g.94489 Transcript_33224/m.94489 type:complete len:141 (+) Transcript_33224:52-474(+)